MTLIEFNIIDKLKKNKYLNKLGIITFCSLLSFQTCQSASGWGNIETKLIYNPINKTMADVRLKLDRPLEDTYYYSLDGIKLNAWYIPAKTGMATIVYCHGQGENISLWQSVAQFLINNGYGVFMIDYRGHGKSKGAPFESGLYTDLESAVKYLKDYKNIEKKDIVLWGRSLGGAVVADVASRDDEFKGVILESTFTNIREAALHLTNNGILEGKRHFWGSISTCLVKCIPLTQTFETDKKIHKIKSPLIIAGSIHDETIPVEMSKELATLNSNAILFISDKGCHHSSEWFKPQALEFLKSLN